MLILTKDFLDSPRIIVDPTVKLSLNLLDHVLLESERRSDMIFKWTTRSSVVFALPDSIVFGFNRKLDSVVASGDR